MFTLSGLLGLAAGVLLGLIGSRLQRRYMRRQVRREFHIVRPPAEGDRDSTVHREVRARPPPRGPGAQARDSIPLAARGFYGRRRPPLLSREAP